MQLHQIKRNKNNRHAKQVGRGGKRGKTSGKGTKGQNARAGRKKRPEMRDIIKKFPKLRGRGKHYLKSIQKMAFVIKTSILDAKFSTGETVNIATILEKGIVKKINNSLPRVKVVADGEVKKKLSVVGLPISLTARDIIVKAGGSVE